MKQFVCPQTFDVFNVEIGKVDGLHTRKIYRENFASFRPGTSIVSTPIFKIARRKKTMFSGERSMSRAWEKTSSSFRNYTAIGIKSPATHSM